MQEVLAQARLRLDEHGTDLGLHTKQAQWRNVALRRWANEGMRDLARQTHYLMDTDTVTLTASTAEYTCASDVLWIYAAFYVPGDGRRVPLTPRAFNALDQIWGDSQNTWESEPQIYTTLGHSPIMKIRFFPVPPTTNETVTLHVARLPAEKATDGSEDTDALELPEAWVDMVVDYVEFMALRKDRDQRWMEAKALYDTKMQEIKEVQEGHSAAQEMVFDSTFPLPGWLVNGY